MSQWSAWADPNIVGPVPLVLLAIASLCLVRLSRAAGFLLEKVAIALPEMRRTIEWWSGRHERRIQRQLRMLELRRELAAAEKAPWPDTRKLQAGASQGPSAVVSPAPATHEPKRGASATTSGDEHAA